MPMYPNYIADTNPYHLSGPPTWFQKQLWEYDPSLVIVPSRQGFMYRLAQKRKLKLPEKVINDVLKEQADTRMLASYSLVPVTTILATVNWGDPFFFQELNRRAPWRMGGAEKFTKIVEEQDKREEIQKAEYQDDLLNYLSKDAWRYYNKQIGTRSHMWSPTTKDKPETKNKAHSLIIPATKYTPAIRTGWGNTLRKGA